MGTSSRFSPFIAMNVFKNQPTMNRDIRMQSSKFRASYTASSFVNLFFAESQYNWREFLEEHVGDWEQDLFRISSWTQWLRAKKCGPTETVALRMSKEWVYVCLNLAQIADILFAKGIVYWTQSL
jgi:hypothetical protein